MDYNELLTFYLLSSTGYQGVKQISDSELVPCIFSQNTSIARRQQQENIDADALCYPDFNNDFIFKYANRLEGMYIVANVFEGTESKSWYKVDTCIVNRDVLLDNEIDNIELRLKKVEALPNIS